VPVGSAANGELRPVLPPDSDPNAPLVVNVPIEDHSGRALATFYAALERIGTEHRQARVVVYGASHVASDLYTDIVRSKLQARFGDAGVGFVQPMRAVSGYRSAGVNFEQASGWATTHVKAKTPIEDRYGLAGMYLSAPRSKKGARTIFTTRPHGGESGNADTIELWYLRQPHGGKLRVSIDDSPRKPLSTQAREIKPGYERYEVDDGQHRVELSAAGDGPVQLFGVVLERSQPGVVVDSLGVPGSRARYHLLWDDTLYREHLQRRKPDLVVLAYGTNESGDDDEPIERYESDLRKVLERIRGVVPEASCLLVGPSDRPIENPDGTFVDRPRTSQIVETQRKLSAEFGCGFFDMVAFMGGRLSMLRWVNSLPPLGTPDYVHFTRVGYEALGNALHTALMAGFTPPATPSALPPTASTSLNGKR
jgi:lysophospholipase L1-like esterase